MIKVGFNAAIWTRDGHSESFARALDEMSLTGWDGIELSQPIVDGYMSNPKVFRRVLEMHDLELSSCYSHLAFIYPEKREEEFEATRRKAEFAAETGARFLLLDGGRQRPGGNSEDDYKVVAEQANRIGEMARSLDLTLAWHQHWGTMFEWPEPLDRLMELTDPGLVKFCPDTAQLTMGGFDVPATFRKYADRIGYVHFKDVVPNVKFGDRGRPSDTGGYRVDSKWRMVELGRGVVDFEACFEALRSVGYSGWIVDDYDFTGYSKMESSAICRRYLGEVLGLKGRRGWWPEDPLA